MYVNKIPIAFSQKFEKMQLVLRKSNSRIVKLLVGRNAINLTFYKIINFYTTGVHIVRKIISFGMRHFPF